MSSLQSDLRVKQACILFLVWGRMSLNVHLKRREENPRIPASDLYGQIIWLAVASSPHSKTEALITQTHALKSNTHSSLCDYVSQPFSRTHAHTHTQTLHSFGPCPSTASNLDSKTSKRVVEVTGETWTAEKDKASHAILGEAARSESVTRRWLVRGMRKLHWNPFMSRGMQPLKKKSWWKTRVSLSVPAVVLYHVGQLDDELPLLVLLTKLKGLFLQEGIKGLRENILLEHMSSIMRTNHHVLFSLKEH